MKVELNQPILDLRGKPVKQKDEDSGEVKTLLLKDCVVNALFSQLPGDDHMTGETKLKITLLGIKIESGVGDFTVDEVLLFKERIGKMYVQLISGRCWMLLEQMSNPAEVPNV